MDPTTLRHTLAGALIAGGATAVLATIQAYRAGASSGAIPLVLFFVVLAATVGALAGPLVGGVIGRIRGDHDRS